MEPIRIILLSWVFFAFILGVVSLERYILGFYTVYLSGKVAYVTATKPEIEWQRRYEHANN